MDSGKTEVATGVSFPVRSVEVGEGPTLVCVFGRHLWQTGKRAGTLGPGWETLGIGWIPKPPQWTGRCFGVGLLGIPTLLVSRD